MKISKKRIVIGLILAFLPFAAVLAAPAWTLNSLSGLLVYEDSLTPAQAIIILGGSSSGNRIRTAVQLFKIGYAPLLVISGYEFYPGYFNHEAMRRYAIQLGVSPDRILAEPSSKERSTWGEARANLALLKKRSIHNFILVTSSFHTRRVKKLMTQ